MRANENDQAGFMAEVTPVEEKMIRKEMERVIQERIKKEAPPDALY